MDYSTIGIAFRGLLRNALLISISICIPAYAASFSANGGTGTGPVYFKAEQIISLSKKMERTLAAKGARVAIIGRVGRPVSELPEGMHYTHAAFAVYSEITTGDGRHVQGYAMFNEYQVDERPDTSTLVQDYPVDFFAGVAELKAGIIIPSAELQTRLLEVIASPTYKALHEPRYSAIANPYTLGRQNCTEFVLDVVNAAIYQTDDIRVIKANEKAFFVAQPVNVNPLKLMLGAMFSSEISMSDQPEAPVTATFERLADYLQKYDRGSEVFTVAPDFVQAPERQRLDKERNGRITISGLGFDLGDDVQTVKAALKTAIDPEPMERNAALPAIAMDPNRGKTFLHLRTKGIWAFFNARGKLETIRLDAPFSNAVLGIRIGDSLGKLTSTLGNPLKKPWIAFGTLEVYQFALDDTAYVNFDVNDDGVQLIFITR
ncbi:MAG: DUF2145 domain-containing protein [Proteobacteria bacterium]|nr:DUF2145 domain-containing protein [Pseudomonadota bacterium]